jgi:hypothetical protein
MSAASTGAAKTTGIKADDPEVGQCGTTDRDRPALLEIPMAKGQKRSNREFKEAEEDGRRAREDSRSRTGDRFARQKRKRWANAALTGLSAKSDIWLQQ